MRNLAHRPRETAPSFANSIRGFILAIIELDRPGHDEYFMGIAFAVRERATCRKRKVGAVLVRDGRIIATGYNGTPEAMPNCDDAEMGCYRCAHEEEFEAGTGYDLCICVHAEQNALLSAARFGIASEGATLYTTIRPCFGCTKEALQAKIEAIYYVHNWAHPNEQIARQYDVIQARLPGGVRPLSIADPREVSDERPLEATGHEAELPGTMGGELPAESGSAN